VNDEPIDGTVLRPGDRVEIGDLRLALEEQETP